MPKQTKKDLQELLLEQVTLNRDLAQRLQDMEARMQHMADVNVPRENPPAYTPPDANSSNLLMMETARIIQDSSSVEKTSPYLDGVDEVSWQAFSLKFIHYRTKGGKKPTRDLLSPSVTHYYGSQIAGNIWQMGDIDLYYAINTINQPNLEPINILISSLSMKPSKVYVKKLVQEYISSFLTVLANFPIIRNQCAPYAVVKQLFKKLQPHSLAQDMLNLEINDVNLAVQTLHQKLKTKDIQEFENSRNSVKHDVSEPSSASTGFKLKCANCQYSTKPES